jgi:hypothetical protein
MSITERREWGGTAAAAVAMGKLLPKGLRLARGDQGS